MHPNTPLVPDRSWSALTLRDGTHHVWPAYQDDDNEEHNSHVGYMHANGISPESVKTYWHWDPKASQAWKNLNSYRNDYRDWYFGSSQNDADDDEGPAEQEVADDHSDLVGLPSVASGPHHSDGNERKADGVKDSSEHTSITPQDDPYYNPEFDQPSDDKWWEKVKPGSQEVHDLHELQPWVPGKEGKGILTNDGTVITWDNIGIHHPDVVQLLGRENVHELLDYITPEGDVGIPNTNPADWAALRGAGLHPFLYNWHF